MAIRHPNTIHAHWIDAYGYSVYSQKRKLNQKYRHSKGTHTTKRFIYIWQNTLDPYYRKYLSMRFTLTHARQNKAKEKDTLVHALTQWYRLNDVLYAHSCFHVQCNVFVCLFFFSLFSFWTQHAYRDMSVYVHTKKSDQVEAIDCTKDQQ